MGKTGKPRFIIVGGGLGGALMANFLGQSGYHADVYELRGDLREIGAKGGRSINLALSCRGIAALERVGLAESVLSSSVPMVGRMMHAPDGTLTHQPYGTEDHHTINSVSRGGLNAQLLTAAERFDTVRLFFNKKCVGVEPDRREIELEDQTTGVRETVAGDVILSADGAFSVVRRAFQRMDRYDYSQDYLDHGYKELCIPAGANGSFQLEKNALHIWPRGSYMMIALPNLDGSFTCTLFWPFSGPNSFEAVQTKEDLLAFFHRIFPDAVPLMPTLVDDFFSNPVGSLVTVRSKPWFYEDKVVLLGDACHAVVPFYGQGMNASFEDVLVLSECLDRFAPDTRRAFASYDEQRRPHVNVLADLALANFIEMRDHTGSKYFLLKKKLEKALHRLFPRWYVPLYTMATFTRMPYGDAVQKTRRQNSIVKRVVAAVSILLLVLIVWLLS